MLHPKRDSLLELVDSISMLTDHAVQAGPGPYGIGIGCSHPSQISVVFEMEPDFVRLSPDQSQELWGYEDDQEVKIAVKAYDIRANKVLEGEQIDGTLRDIDPAHANAIRTLVDTQITVSGREVHDVFDVLVQRELAAQEEMEKNLHDSEDLAPTMGLG